MEVAHVWLRKGEWKGSFELSEKSVKGITPFLTVPGQSIGNPEKLAANQGNSHIGSYVLGMGYILAPDEAQALIKKDQRNADVLFPYLNGQDLNSRPDQSPSRWVINFFDWPLDVEHEDLEKPKGSPYAADYPDCLSILREKVKPERDTKKRKQYREIWWQYAEKQKALYGAIEGCDRVLVRSRVSNINSIAFVPTGLVMSEATVVFNFQDYGNFALLQGMTHTEWLTHYASSMRNDVRYTPSDCFETFPFPTQTNTLETIGDRYYTHRQSIMLTTQQGLTKTYNRFHNPDDTAPDITQLRTLHIEMDTAVAVAYGWQDLKLDHDFHETKQGLRFTISEAARREVLDRLLALNHERYAEEVKQGLHDKNKKKGKKTKAKKAAAKKVDPSDEQQIKLFF